MSNASDTCRLEMENMELKKKLATSEKKVAKMSLELEVICSFWSNDVNRSRLDGNRDAVAMHAREITDAIIADPKRLHDATQLDGEQFGVLLERLTKYTLSLEDAPLFLEDDNGRSGNRCKLTRQGAPVLGDMYKNRVLCQTSIVRKVSPHRIKRIDFPYNRRAHLEMYLLQSMYKKFC